MSTQSASSSATIAALMAAVFIVSVDWNRLHEEYN